MSAPPIVQIAKLMSLFLLKFGKLGKIKMVDVKCLFIVNNTILT